MLDSQLQELLVRVERLEMLAERRSRSGGQPRINGPREAQEDRRREYLAEVGREEPSRIEKRHPAKKPRLW